ncbi:MAG: glycosyltransferase [Gilvibacter sp.]
MLVCAKNEAQNLKEHIPLWLAQTHPKFELILVDDDSTDNTREVIEQFAKEDSRIVPVYVSANDRFVSGKKYALTLGIKKARHTRMIFTDADCKPASVHWLAIMSTHFNQQKAIVLGFGAYSKKISLLNSIIRFETFMTALQYFSYAKLGKAYMGVGRNLGYTRHLYEEQNGFSAHMHVASGDDDLFVNAAATPQNVSLCTESKAFTYSKAKTSFASWFIQKRRHISTATFYKPSHKLLLGLYYVANFAFWALAIAGLIVSLKEAAIIIGVRVAVQLSVYLGAAKKLKQLDLVLLAPLLELFLICLQLPIFIANLVSSKPRWN